jgi:hypothetical protein
VMHLADWDEWCEVRDNSAALKPVIDGFAPLADANAVRTLFVEKIPPR